MKVPSRWLTRRKPLVGELASTAGSEVIQAAAKATLNIVGLGAVSDVAAGVLKQTFIVVLAEVTKVQNTIDPLVSHAMMTGLVCYRMRRTTRMTVPMRWLPARICWRAPTIGSETRAQPR